MKGIEALTQEAEAGRDERNVQARMKWFVEKWATAMDLNKRDTGEMAGDLAVVIQAVHRDASRETHALLTRALAAMPSPTLIVPKKAE